MSAIRWRCRPYPFPADLVEGGYYPITARAPGEAAKRFAERNPDFSRPTEDADVWTVDVTPDDWDDDNAAQAAATFGLTPAAPVRIRVTRGWSVEVVPVAAVGGGA